MKFLNLAVLSLLFLLLGCQTDKAANLGQRSEIDDVMDRVAQNCLGHYYEMLKWPELKEATRKNGTLEQIYIETPKVFRKHIEIRILRTQSITDLKETSSYDYIHQRLAMAEFEARKHDKHRANNYRGFEWDSELNRVVVRRETDYNRIDRLMDEVARESGSLLYETLKWPELDPETARNGSLEKLFIGTPRVIRESAAYRILRRSEIAELKADDEKAYQHVLARLESAEIAAKKLDAARVNNFDGSSLDSDGSIVGLKSRPRKD